MRVHILTAGALLWACQQDPTATPAAATPAKAATPEPTPAAASPEAVEALAVSITYCIP